MTSYQKSYENKVGAARINITKAVAGTKINCRLTYRAGSLGIDDSGSMKVLFRIITDSADPQFDNPKDDNYLKISSSNKDIKITPGPRSGGLYGKIHPRPWSKGFVLNFSNGYLSEDDEIYIDFHRWRVQTFCEKTFEFKILVDPFATARYIELPQSPELEIIPDRPHKLVIIAPTKVKTHQPFEFLIKLEDRWGNPCVNQGGMFEKIRLIPAGGGTKTGKQVGKNPPEKLRFKQGRAKAQTEINAHTTLYIKAKYDNLVAFSNPVTAFDKFDHGYYWADLHGQSEETVGTNNVSDYFHFAKNYAFLDIAGHQGNDFQISKKFWRKLNRTTRKINRPGKFIAFPGYEWSGNTAVGGDRNVIYLEEGLPIYRSSHALIEEFDDLETDARTAEELFEKLPPEKTIVLAHVGGRFADLARHDESLERAVEIHSDWGTFEWLLFEALERGYRVGVVAGSDGHTGRPGASYPSFAHFNSYGGLTCILAKQLTRKSVFQALRARHCYATTGARLFLEVKSVAGAKKTAIMGDVSRATENQVLRVHSYGTSPLDRLEIFNGTKLIHRHFPDAADEAAKTVKIVWSGSSVKGRARKFLWNGNVKVKDGAIVDVKPINFFNQKNYVKHDGQTITWEGETTGGLQGIILKLDNPVGKLLINLNARRFNLPIEAIMQKPREYSMGGLDARLEVYQTTSSEQPYRLEYEYKIPPNKLSKKVNPLFVKIIQKDGHLAWSSPIFLEK
jgi:hypothetical protein